MTTTAGYASQDVGRILNREAGILLKRLEKSQIKPLISMLVAYETYKAQPNKSPDAQQIWQTPERQKIVKIYEEIKRQAATQSLRLTNDGFALSVMATLFRDAHDETFRKVNSQENTKSAIYNAAAATWWATKSVAYYTLMTGMVVGGVALAVVGVVAAIATLGEAGGDVSMPDLSDMSPPDFRGGGGDFGGAGATGTIPDALPPPIIADVPAGRGSGRGPSLVLSTLDPIYYGAYDLPSDGVKPRGVREKNFRKIKRLSLASGYFNTRGTLRRATQGFSSVMRPAP